LENNKTILGLMMMPWSCMFPKTTLEKHYHTTPSMSTTHAWFPSMPWSGLLMSWSFNHEFSVYACDILNASFYCLEVFCVAFFYILYIAFLYLSSVWKRGLGYCEALRQRIKY
jgi:hypothetical protein